MPSIADQVATLEHDLTAALAQVDALGATKAALESANASLQRDNVALQLEINDMKHYVDDTRAMAERLASSALDMLRASRRQVGAPAEVIPFAPNMKTDHLTAADITDIRSSVRAAQVERLADLAGVMVDGGPKAFMVPGPGGVGVPSDSLDAKVAALPDTWPPTLNTAIKTAMDQTAVPPINEFAPRSLEPTHVIHGEDDLPVFLVTGAPMGSSRAMFG